MDLKKTLILLYSITNAYFVFSQTTTLQKVETTLQKIKLLESSNPNKAEKAYEKLINELQNAENFEYSLNSKTKYCSFLINIGKFDKANKIIAAAISNPKSLSFLNRINKLKQLNGTILMQQNNCLKAIVVLTSVLKYFDETKNIKESVITKSHLAWCYYLLEKYGIAIKYLKECIEVQKRKYPNNVAFLYEKLAIQYAQYENKKDSAYYFFKKAELEYTKNGFEDKRAYVLNNLGSLYFLNDDFKNAVLNYENALTIFNKIGNESENLYLYSNLGIGYTNLNNLVKAEYYLKKTKDIAEQTKDTNMIATFYKNMAILNEKKGNYKIAIQNYKDYLNLYMYVNESKNNAELFELTKQIEVITKQNEISKLKENENKQKFKLLIIGFISFTGLLLLAIISYFVYKKNKTEKIIMLSLFEKKQKTIAEKSTEEERKRISRDLHDNIGSYAAAIINNINLLNLNEKESPLQPKLDDIKANASNVLNSIRETIVILSNTKFNLFKVVENFKNYTAEIIQSHSNIKLNFTEKLITNYILNSVDSIHLTYLLKEIFNNAIKHSKCNEIHISIIQTDKDLTIEIKDNGIGFDLTNYEPKNGMENLQYRAEKLSAKLNIKSAINKGTSITVKRKFTP